MNNRLVEGVDEGDVGLLSHSLYAGNSRTSRGMTVLPPSPPVRNT